MKILITGNMGYIGPVLVNYLRKNLTGAELIGFDTAYFGHSLTNAPTLPESLLDRQIFGDVRDLSADLYEGIDAVIQLAAISNDPMGNKFERVTDEINHQASVASAKLARDAGAKAFVFASSCSMYGQADGAARKETDTVNPLTAYARSKDAVERTLKDFDPGDMAVTCLRFSTACGFSPRLRLDLVLNDFVACALTSGKITVLSDGSPWRPLIDVEDMSRAMHWAITRSKETGGQHLAINVGRNEWNYQVKDLAQAVASAVPNTVVEINTDAPPDKRSYKVDFSLFEELAPAHLPQVSLDMSIERLCDGLRGMNFNVEDFRNSQFMRLRILDAHLAAGRLDNELRWTGDTSSRQAAAA